MKKVTTRFWLQALLPVMATLAMVGCKKGKPATASSQPGQHAPVNMQALTGEWDWSALQCQKSGAPFTVLDSPPASAQAEWQLITPYFVSSAEVSVRNAWESANKTSPNHPTPNAARLNTGFHFEEAAHTVKLKQKNADLADTEVMLQYSENGFLSASDDPDQQGEVRVEHRDVGTPAETLLLTLPPEHTHCDGGNLVLMFKPGQVMKIQQKKQEVKTLIDHFMNHMRTFFQRVRNTSAEQQSVQKFTTQITSADTKIAEWNQADALAKVKAFPDSQTFALKLQSHWDAVKTARSSLKNAEQAVSDKEAALATGSPELTDKKSELARKQAEKQAADEQLTTLTQQEQAKLGEVNALKQEKEKNGARLLAIANELANESSDAKVMTLQQQIAGSLTQAVTDAETAYSSAKATVDDGTHPKLNTEYKALEAAKKAITDGPAVDKTDAPWRTALLAVAQGVSKTELEQWLAYYDLVAEMKAQADAIRIDGIKTYQEARTKSSNYNLSKFKTDMEDSKFQNLVSSLKPEFNKLKTVYTTFMPTEGWTMKGDTVKKNEWIALFNLIQQQRLAADTQLNGLHRSLYSGKVNTLQDAYNQHKLQVEKELLAAKQLPINAKADAEAKLAALEQQRAKLRTEQAGLNATQVLLGGNDPGSVKKAEEEYAQAQQASKKAQEKVSLLAGEVPAIEKNIADLQAATAGNAELSNLKLQAQQQQGQLDTACATMLGALRVFLQEQKMVLEKNLTAAQAALDARYGADGMGGTAWTDGSLLPLFEQDVQKIHGDTLSLLAPFAAHGALSSDAQAKTAMTALRKAREEIEAGLQALNVLGHKKADGTTLDRLDIKNPQVTKDDPYLN